MNIYDKEKISIIIPAYNASKTIKRCLDSIINQTYGNLEIIVVDDGSKDTTLSILKECAELESRIKVISKQNGGAASARNVGLKEVTGEYITFLDADDYIECEVYEKLYELMQKKNLDIVSASIREIYIDNHVEERVNDNNLPVIDGEKALCDMFSYAGGIRTVVWDKLYKKQVIEGIYFDEKCPYGEDTLFNCEAMLKCNRYGRISYIGYTYDHRESQMTGKKYSSESLCNVSVIDKMQNIMLKYNSYTGNLKDSFNLYKIMIYRQLFNSMLHEKFYYAIKDDYLYLRQKSRSVKLRDIRKHLSFKHQIQWVVYLYLFKLYQIFC